MKRLLLIGLTTILGIGSLATGASADIFIHISGDSFPRASGAHNSYSNRESYKQEETPKLSPIPEPLKYRVERRPETVEPEIQKDHQWQRADRYVPEDNYYQERRRQIRFRRHYHGTRNDPGRY
jgi:hypothetical protein